MPRPADTIFRRLLILVLAAVLPLAAVISYALYQQFQVDRSHALAQLHLLREVNSRQLSTYLANAHRKLKVLAEGVSQQAGHHDKIEQRLRQFVDLHPAFANVALMDQAGRVRAAANRRPVSPDSSLLGFSQFRRAVESPDPRVSHPFKRAVIDEWSCLISYPVVNKDGTRTCTLAVPINLPEFSLQLNLPPAMTGSSINVLDASSGTIVMHLPEDVELIGKQVPDFKHIKASLAAGQRDNILCTDLDGTTRTVSIAAIPNTPWLICATMPTKGILHDAWMNFWQTLTGLGIFLIAVGVLIWRHARNIERPIRALAAATHTQTPAPIPAESPAEITATIEAFNAMLVARQDAETSLAESEHRYRTVIDQTGQMIYDLDVRNKHYSFFGHTAIHSITGYTQEEYNQLGVDGWKNMLHPDDRDTVTQRIRDAISTGQPTHGIYRICHKNGDYRFIEEQGVVVSDDQGAATHLLGCVVDITARKQADQVLHETKAWLLSIINTIDGIVWEVDASTFQFTFVSSQAKRILGYAPTRWVEEHDFWINHMHPEDRNWAPTYCLDKTRGNQDHDFEYRMIAADGREVWLHDVVSLVREQGKPTRLRGVMVDITERKLAEEEHDRLEHKLMETQKLERLGVLAGGIAHDFNNLLTSILGHANLAQMQMPKGSPGLDAVVQIETASLRAADLCKQMLAYAGKGSLTTHAVDLNALIKDVTQLLEVSTQKRARLQLDLAGLLPSINADATQLRQVIMNLVINASEAANGTDALITLRTGSRHVTAEELARENYQIEISPGDYVWIEVADNGIGMTAETLRQIFDPFFTTKPTGSGLGLAAVIGIVRSHHGTLKVGSTPGVGTRVKLLLPAIGASAEKLKKKEAAPKAWRGEGTLLVVDDEASVRIVLRKALTFAGFQVEEAIHGAEAVGIFQENPDRYTAVLLDLTMPQLNGEQTFQRLQAIRPDVKVLLMSGYNRQAATTHFPGSGFAGFLHKPFTLATLLTEVKAMLHGADHADNEHG